MDGVIGDDEDMAELGVWREGGRRLTGEFMRTAGGKDRRG